MRPVSVEAAAAMAGTPVKRQASLGELWEGSPAKPSTPPSHKKLLASPSHNSLEVRKAFFENLEATKRARLEADQDPSSSSSPKLALVPLVS